MHPISLEQLFDKIDRHEVHGASIYEGKHKEYPTGKAYFEKMLFPESETPKDDLKKALKEFADKYNGRYTVFIYGGNRRPDGMVRCYVEFAQSPVTVNGLQAQGAAPDAFTSYLLSREERLMNKLEELEKERREPETDSTERLMGIVERVCDKIFQPSVQMAPAKSKVDLNGMNEQEQEKTLGAALQFLTELLGAETMVNLAAKLREPENEHFISIIKKAANDE